VGDIDFFHKKIDQTVFFITNGRWVIFYPKAGASRGEGAFKFVLCRSYFWLWLWMTANLFGLAVGFWQKQKQVKAQPKALLVAHPSISWCTDLISNKLTA
jgi:hypothetical protein